MAARPIVPASAIRGSYKYWLVYDPNDFSLPHSVWFGVADDHDTNLIDWDGCVVEDRDRASDSEWPATWLAIELTEAEAHASEMAARHVADWIAHARKMWARLTGENS